MRTSLCGLAVLGLLLAGCATDRPLSFIPGLASLGLVEDARQVSRLEKSLTDGDIATWLDADIRAKLPTSLALVKLRSACRGYQPELVAVESAELEAWEKCLPGEGSIRGLRTVGPVAVGSERVTMHALRQAAARTNCELLLVVLQGDSAVDNFNEASVLYWTIVGLWLVPGDVLEHRTMMQAALVDCRTGAILGTATGDSHLKRTCPAAFADIQQNRLSQEAPPKAAAQLQASCKRLLKEVVGAVARPAGQ